MLEKFIILSGTRVGIPRVIIQVEESLVFQLILGMFLGKGRYAYPKFANKPALTKEEDDELVINLQICK